MRWPWRMPDSSLGQRAPMSPDACIPAPRRLRSGHRCERRPRSQTAISGQSATYKDHRTRAAVPANGIRIRMSRHGRPGGSPVIQIRRPGPMQESPQSSTPSRYGGMEPRKFPNSNRAQRGGERHAPKWSQLPRSYRRPTPYIKRPKKTSECPNLLISGRTVLVAVCRYCHSRRLGS
jgi:hypothetical protein